MEMARYTEPGFATASVVRKLRKSGQYAYVAYLPAGISDIPEIFSSFEAADAYVRSLGFSRI